MRVSQGRTDLDLEKSVRTCHVLVPPAEAGSPQRAVSGEDSGDGHSGQRKACAWTRGRSRMGCLLELVLGSSRAPQGTFPPRRGQKGPVRPAHV